MRILFLWFFVAFTCSISLVHAEMYSNVGTDPRCNTEKGNYEQHAGIDEAALQCGQELLNQGWHRLFYCDNGHQWYYVLTHEDDQQTRVCEGINALGGPEETPCIAISKYASDAADSCIKDYLDKNKE